MREDNGQTGFTYVHTYDNAGNITSSAKYVLTPEDEAPTVLISTESYVYSSDAWGDLLTSYNNGQITYDELGNPLSYYNGATFTWTGRRLTGATKSGVQYTFTYNDAGIRTSKTKGEATTVYYLSGSTILGEKTGEKLTVYIYDANGLPMGFAYSATGNDFDVYWYEKNLHGDIVAVYSDAGTKLISYTYDAWGNATISYHNGGEETTAINNPFTYRGYYYDKDLEFYYLQSRYYDSDIGRFISADSYVSTGQGILGNNMFAYCGNNPVIAVDNEGSKLKYILDFLTAPIDSLVNVLAKMMIAKINYEHNSKIEESGNQYGLYEKPPSPSYIKSQNAAEAYRYGLLSASENACEVIAVHNAKVYSLISVILLGNVILFSRGQDKADSPMDITLLGISMLVKLLQLLNALFPMVVTLLGIVIFIIPHPLNADDSMVVTLFGIVI